MDCSYFGYRCPCPECQERRKLSDAEERYVKALRAEAAAVRSLTQAMTPPVLADQLEEQERLYKKAVAERKAALKALEGK